MEINDIYKRLDQKAFVDLGNKKPALIIDRLDKIYEQALVTSDTKAYIFLKRWMNCVEWLETQHIDKKKVNLYFPNDKIQDVKNRLQKVSKNIQLTCGAKQKDNSNIVINANSNINNDLDISLQLPETPNDEPKEKDEISCKELFEILNIYKTNYKKRLLIIDTRKKEDFLESRIAFPDENLINIPINVIDQKIMPQDQNFFLLNERKKIEQYSQKCVEIIILNESNSSLGNIGTNIFINFLKSSLEKWKIFLKDANIVILTGGFQEWMKRYPYLVTDKSIKEFTKKNDTSTDILDYSSCHISNDPPIEKITSPVFCIMHPPGVKVKSSLPSDFKVIKTSDTNMALLNNENSQCSTNLTNNFYAPDNIASDKQLLRNNNIKEAKVVLEKLPIKSFTKPPTRPPVDRSNKPNLDKKLTANTPSQLQEVNRSIFRHDKSEVDVWSREQHDTLRKTELERKLEIKNFKKPQLYPDLSTMKSELNKPNVRAAKQDLNQDKEGIQELRKRVEQTKIEQKMKMEPPIHQSMEIDDEEIYSVPLRSESLTINSGLKRSHSSPSLTQVKKLKAPNQKDESKRPEFSRSLKPNRGCENTSYSRPMSGISLKNREQRMEPVYASSGLHPGITGLKNLGNSCYMNSIIQCLSNTAYLAQYFINNSYINDLNKNTDKGVTGYVAEEVAQVIKALWRGQYKSISPRDLKVVVGQYKLQFESYDQQDSHEFLMFLLDWMHNDLKQKSKVSYDRPLTTAEKEWEKSMDGQSSIISDLFFGQLRSTIECLYCGKNSTTYETFNSLTMSLPVSSRCTLDDCVRKFVSGQNVSGWKCPSCKVPREGVKKFDIAKLPHIIVIHLNRFGDTGGWLEKKNTAVEFPLSNFNLRTYLSLESDSLHNSQISNYNLYAMSNHYGTMDGGHYTAYCKSNTQNKWYKYDDHTVTEVHQSQVKNQSNSAYLLFYTSVLAEAYLNS